MFRVAASDSGWREQELKGVFIRSLAAEIKDEMTARNESSSLEELIS